MCPNGDLAHPPCPRATGGFAQTGLGLRDEHGMNGLLGASGMHKELRAWKKGGRCHFSFYFLPRRDDFHGRMAICGGAALGWAGSSLAGPISLALGAWLIFTRPLLIEIVQNILGTHRATGTGTPILVAACAYQPLNSIHPFEDGNGRSCQFLDDYILAKHGIAVPAYGIYGPIKPRGEVRPADLQ